MNDTTANPRADGAVEPRLPRGFRDLLPEQMIARQRIIETIRRTYELYGFVPLETAAVEHLDVLTGSAGDEAHRSIFEVRNPDRLRTVGDHLALRFDLTVPLARVVAQYPDLPRPFRRYQVSPVWRADKPGPGRYREFVQFDIDAVGVESEVSDTEIITAMCDTLTALDAGDYRIKFSSRRILNLLLDFAGVAREEGTNVFRVLDKQDRIGLDNVRRELTTGYHDESGDQIEGLGLSPTQVERIEQFLAIVGETRGAILNQLHRLFADVPNSEQEIAELTSISDHLYSLGYGDDKVVLDLSIARGLAYYTGPVFEAVLLDAPQFGSVMGGGRYDDLVMRFLGERVPATGASIGVDRLQVAMSERMSLRRATAAVLVTVFNRDLMPESLKLAYELRRSGVPTELYYGSETGIAGQVRHADVSGIPLVVILGPDELAKGVVSLKDMAAGRDAAKAVTSRTEWRQQRPGQYELSRDALASELQRHLGVMEG